MKNTYLDSATKLQIKLGGTVVTTQLDWTCSYYNRVLATGVVTEGEFSGVTNNGTAVDILPAPAAGSVRVMKNITVYNADTQTNVVVIQLVDAGGTRVLIRNSLTSLASRSADDMSFYTDISGKLDVSAKATGAEVDTGTDDAKYVTAKAIEDSSYMKNPMTTAGDIIYGGASGLPTRLAKGTDGQVLVLESGVPSWSNASGSGTSFWTAVPGTPTRTGNNTFTLTDTGNTNKYDLLLQRCTILKWEESSTVKQAMIVSATYATNTVTVTIMGDTMSSIDASSLKYGAEKARVWKFALAGTIGATGTNVMNTVMAECPAKPFGIDLWAGTAGNGTTTIDCNKGGTTMFTTKPSITTTAQSSLGNSVDSGTTIATGDMITIDQDAVATTTKIIDEYVNLYYTPLYNYYLS